MPADPRRVPALVLDLAIGAALSMAVVFPLAGRGWLLLLDWTTGPYIELPSLASGLGKGVPTSAGLDALFAFLRVVAGPARAGWLVPFLALAGAFVAMARLVGGGLSRRLPAGGLYLVNPVVFERLYVGQFGYLLAYAVLPLVAKALIDACHRGRRSRWIDAALWSAIAIAFTPHAAWIVALLLLGIAVTSPSVTTAKVVAGFGLAMLFLQLYLIVPTLLGRPPAVIGGADLDAFATKVANHTGALGNVVALYGFWRRGPVLPKDQFAGWWLVLLAMLVVVGVGTLARSVAAPDRTAARALGLAAVVGLVLAAGDAGPTGSLFRWAFDHVPGFDLMREPQKFVASLAVFYAFAFGLGVDALLRTASSVRARRAAIAIACLLPIAYTPTLFAGLAGQVGPTHVPGDWLRIDAAVGPGQGRVLFLPWHQYLRFPFTERVVANPAPAFFRRPVIAGDNPEVGRIAGSGLARSAYLEFLLSEGPKLCAFGDLVTPLGVEYVVVAKAADWRSLSWLDGQVDLERRDESGSFVVYRNLRYRGPGYVAPTTRQAPDWNAVIRLSESGQVGEAAVQVVRDQPGTANQPPIACAPPSTSASSAVGLRREGDGYHLPPGRAGVAVLPESYDRSWAAGTGPPVRLLASTTGLRADGLHLSATRSDALWVKAAWACSALSGFGLLVIRRRRRGVDADDFV
jgi:hypothetical protein